jgi:Ca2+-binding RTX toxin-like protein
MTELRVTIKNTSETGGTFLTPVWFGFHDESFDLFNTGQAASPGLERLAEDGDTAPLGVELLAADADGQGFVVTGAAGPIATQETTSAFFTVNGDSNAFVSFASMIIPSNDAFIGTGDAVQLFDANGRFLGEKTIKFAGEDAHDAGTEVNTELDAAFINQTAPNTGQDEHGVVHRHPGFNGSLGNPVGEGDQIILGGTNDAGEFVDPVAADFTRPGAELAVVHINTVRFNNGTDGRDFIIGRGDDDIVSAGKGNDAVFGGDGWDVIDGGAGDDILFGGRGDDMLGGGDGRDKIFGDAGDDLIAGGKGNDWLVGGGGADTFFFNAGDGDDTIALFSNRDRIALNVEGIDDFDDVLAHAEQRRFGVEIDFAEDGSIFLLAHRLPASQRTTSCSRSRLRRAPAVACVRPIFRCQDEARSNLAPSKSAGLRRTSSCFPRLFPARHPRTAIDVELQESQPENRAVNAIRRGGEVAGACSSARTPGAAGARRAQCRVAGAAPASRSPMRCSTCN